MILKESRRKKMQRRAEKEENKRYFGYKEKYRKRICGDDNFL